MARMPRAYRRSAKYPPPGQSHAKSIRSGFIADRAIPVGVIGITRPSPADFDPVPCMEGLLEAIGDVMSTEPTRSRLTVVDRRLGTDRRDALPDTNLERRRGPGRRRSDFRRDADEGTFDTEQMYFLKAIEMWRREAKLFDGAVPCWNQVLQGIRSIGYRRTAMDTIRLTNSEALLAESREASLEASPLEQARFQSAMETFRDVTEVHLPQWTDVLEVIRRLGYRKVQPCGFNLRGRIEEFTERPDAPARVDRTGPEGSGDQPASLNQSTFFST